MAQFSSPFGGVSLARHPARPNDPFRPFDGADRLLLDEVSEAHSHAQRIWVIGDRQGALTVTLAGPAARQVTTFSDSAIACSAIERNLAANEGSATVQSAELAGDPPELILVRPPTSAAMLLDQLSWLGRNVPAGTPLVLGEMSKHLRPWMTAALTDQFGPTSASLGRHKARLLRSIRDQSQQQPPAWTSYPVTVAGQPVTLHNSPGTFSASGLDRGTRLLLDHLPTTEGELEVVDLGCGNGILGIALALTHPMASVTLIDDSAAALASARQSWQGALPGRAATFVHADGLTSSAPCSADLVVCNPPFHAGTVVDEWFGRRLLAQTVDVLTPGGELWVVANRHLAHHQYLKRWFARVEVVAADAKFSVLRAHHG